MSEQPNPKKKALNPSSQQFQSFQPTVQPTPITYPQYQQQVPQQMFVPQMGAPMGYYYNPMMQYQYQQQPQAPQAPQTNAYMPNLPQYVPQQQFQQSLMKKTDDQQGKLKKKGKLKLDSKQFVPVTTKQEQEKTNEGKKEEPKLQKVEEESKKEEKIEEIKKEEIKKEESKKEESQKEESKKEESKKEESQKEESKKEESSKAQPTENQEIKESTLGTEESKPQEQQSASQSNISQLLMSKKSKKVAQPAMTSNQLNSTTNKREIGQVKVMISTQVFVRLVQEAKQKQVANERISEIMKRESQEVKSVNRSTKVESPGKGHGKRPDQQWKQHQQQQQQHQQSNMPTIQREYVSEEQIKMKNQVNQFIQAKREEDKKDSSKKDKKDLKYELNKLCPTNFDNIKHIIEGLVKQNWKYCVYLAKSIIEKAWTEEKYAQTYAKLCCFLMKRIIVAEPPSDQEIDLEMKLDQGVAPAKTNEKKEEEAKQTQEETKEQASGQKPSKVKQSIFKYILLKNIQQMFEEQKDVNDRKQNDESQKKKRILGNVHFIGELFQENVISYKVIFICVTELLKKFYIDYLDYHNGLIRKEKTNAADNYELDLEGIFTFFNQFGQKVSEAEKKKKQETGIQYLSLQFLQNLLIKIHEAKTEKDLTSIDKDLQEYFQKKTADIKLLFEILSFFQDKAKIQPRIKCLIMNLKALREQSWKNAFKKEGPIKVSEIHEEFEQEKIAREQKAQKYYEQEKHYSKQQIHYYQQKKPEFQVTCEPNEQKVEENQEDDQNYDLPTSNLEFTRNFGDYKGQQQQQYYYQPKKQQPEAQQQQQQQQQSASTYTDVEQEICELFKYLNSKSIIKEDCEVPYDTDKFFDDCVTLCKKSKCFISCYLSNFCACRGSQLKERSFIPEKLLRTNTLPASQFISEFNITLKKVWSISEEQPFIYKGLAECFVTIAQAGYANFKDIDIDIVAKQDEDFADMADEFLEKLFKKMYESIQNLEIQDKFNKEFTDLIKRVDKQNNFTWFQ